MFFFTLFHVPFRFLHISGKRKGDYSWDLLSTLPEHGCDEQISQVEEVKINYIFLWETDRKKNKAHIIFCT